MSSDQISRPQSYRPKSDLTCFFWSEGRCNKSAADCNYQHSHTGRIALPRNAVRHHDTYYSVAVPPPLTQNEEVTCYFWHNNGSCRLSDGDCPFVHWHTGKVATGPGGFLRTANAGRESETDQSESTSSHVPRLTSDERREVDQYTEAFARQRAQGQARKL